MSLRNIVLGAASVAALYSTAADAGRAVRAPQRDAAAVQRTAPSQSTWNSAKAAAFETLTCDPFAAHAADYCDPARAAAAAKRAADRRKNWADSKLRLEQHFQAIDNELGGTYVPGEGYTKSRVDQLEDEVAGFDDYFVLQTISNPGDKDVITSGPNSPLRSDVREMLDEALEAAREENDKRYAPKSDVTALDGRVRTLESKPAQFDDNEERQIKARLLGGILRPTTGISYRGDTGAIVNAGLSLSRDIFFLALTYGRILSNGYHQTDITESPLQQNTAAGVYNGRRVTESVDRQDVTNMWRAQLGVRFELLDGLEVLLGPQVSLYDVENTEITTNRTEARFTDVNERVTRHNVGPDSTSKTNVTDAFGVGLCGGLGIGDPYGLQVIPNGCAEYDTRTKELAPEGGVDLRIGF